ncbi:MAG: Asp-tRNA(Asn)/Glu-tRNA(Gln) amidotransferase subunit GatB [Candidatus Nanopelagicales bacterium]
MKLTQAIEQFEPVIGLETHVELSTKSKMFCGCATEFGAEPNTQVCPTCLGLPGSLPVPNQTAIESTMRIGLALNCEITELSRFARKNYFYPDMPKDFQTSQYDEPFCVNGYLDVMIPTDEGEKSFRVEIERVHLEEDTGKLTHAGGATGRIHGADYSLVDYNRAGIPLVEIVTKPVTGTGKYAPQVARAYVTELRDLLRNLGVSDVRMEEGSLRCDVNLSLHPKGSAEWGKRTETKNVNSLRSVEKAVFSEIERQADVLAGGDKVTQETRHFHEDSGTSSSGRSKEQAEDYRYFPEPDLVPVIADETWVSKLKTDLPEAPSVQRKRLAKEWSFSDEEMRDVVSLGAIDLIAQTVSAGASPQAARKWWLGELARRATEINKELSDLSIDPKHISELENLVSSGKLTDKLARQVLEGLLNNEGTPSEIVEKRNLVVMSDDSSLLPIIQSAIAANPDVVAKVKEGKLQALGPLLGAVMKETKGKADAAKVRSLVLKELGVEG